MKNNIYSVSILSFFIFSCFQCSDNKLIVKNNTSKSISIYYSQTRNIINNNLKYYYSHLIEIKPNSKDVFLARNNKWNNIFEESEGNIVTFYIFDTKEFKNKSFEKSLEVFKNNNYLMKIELRKSDLDKMNWVINYPPR